MDADGNGLIDFTEFQVLVCSCSCVCCGPGPGTVTSDDWHRDTEQVCMRMKHRYTCEEIIQAFQVRLNRGA